jgi:hypothetical protein
MTDKNNAPKEELRLEQTFDFAEPPAPIEVHTYSKRAGEIIARGAANSQGPLVLLSQKVAADGEENHLFGKIHGSAMGRLKWICQDRTMVTRGFWPMSRG